MSERPERTAAAPVSATKKSAISTSLEDRLAKARVLRAQALARRDDSGDQQHVSDHPHASMPWETTLPASPENRVSQPDVNDESSRSEKSLKSASWRDPLARARARRAEILAQRGRNVEVSPGTDTANGSQRDRETVLFALSGAREPQAERPEYSEPAVTPTSFEYASTSPANPRRRYGIGIVAAGIAIAFLIGVASSGRLRDFADITANQIAGLFDRSPATPPSLVDVGTISIEPASTDLNLGPLVPSLAFEKNDRSPAFSEPATLQTSGGLPRLAAPVSIMVLEQQQQAPDMPMLASAFLDPSNSSETVKAAMPAKVSARSDPDVPPAHVGSSFAPNPVEQETDASSALDALATLSPETGLPVSPAPEVTDFIASRSFVPDRLKSEGPLRVPANSTSPAEDGAFGGLLFSPAVADSSARVRSLVAPAAIVVNSSDLPVVSGPSSSAGSDVFLPSRLQGASRAMIPGPLQNALPRNDTPVVTKSPDPISNDAVPSLTASTNQVSDLSDDAANLAKRAAYIIHVRAPQSLQESKLDDIVAALRASDYPIKSLKRVSFKISRNNVRFFNEDDAETARVLAAAVGGTALDFTDYLPSPPHGTIEIWLAGISPLRQIPKARSSTIAQPAPESPELLRLRDRLLKSLRRGDYL